MPPDFDPAGFHSLKPATEQTWSDAETVLCRPTALDICTPSKCQPIPPKIHMVWHPKARTYARCSNGGDCDNLEVNVTYLGPQANIIDRDQTHLLKIRTDNGFIETSTLSGAVLVYRGDCDVIDSQLPNGRE